MIQFYNEGVEMPTFNKTKVKAYIKELAAQYEKKAGEIGYNFCTDERILEVNREYLKHDYYTDIITFDYSEGDRISGDIFVSVDTVRSNAAEFGVPFENELHRIIFHGILHLCGIDDQSPEERSHMIECENKALQGFDLFCQESSHS